MKRKFEIPGDYFCGNVISPYGKEHGRLDYDTFSKAFGHVLNNNIFDLGWTIGNGWELVNGLNYVEDNEDEEVEEIENSEVYQWYIVSSSGAEMIQEYTDEILYYHEELDMYLWGVTHWGTAWDYVLMDIPCNCEHDA